MKLDELDAELKKTKTQRDNKQKKLKSKLQSNRSEQEQLRNRLRDLEREDEDLTANIKRNDESQIEADQVFKNSLLTTPST